LESGIICHLIVKCALKAGVADVKSACGSKKLCAGLEAGIEGAIHVMLEKMEENEGMEFGAWEVNNESS
jgi:hypothetical protein